MAASAATGLWGVKGIAERIAMGRACPGLDRMVPPANMTINDVTDNTDRMSTNSVAIRMKLFRVANVMYTRIPLKME